MRKHEKPLTPMQIATVKDEDVDLNCKVLDEEIEQTEAFDWLVRFAGEFGFRLSYPRGNSCGYAYEPWHWCFLKDIPSALRY